MPVPECEIWEAAYLAAMATALKHDPDNPVWRNLPEPWKEDLRNAKFVPLINAATNRGEQVFGPSWAVITLTKAAHERGMTAADFWQKMEEYLARKIVGDPSVDEKWLSR